MVESAAAKRGRYSRKTECPVCVGRGIINTEPTVAWECWGCNGLGYNMLRTQDYNRLTGHLVFVKHLPSIQVTRRQRLKAKRAKKKNKRMSSKTA